MADDPGDELRIVTANRRHAAAIAGIYAPYVTDAATSFEEIAPTEEEMADRIESTLRTHPWLVAEVAGSVAGYAYGSAHRARAAYRWSVDVSVYVDEAFRRRGIASRLYLRLFEILREQGCYNAYAGITQPNEASVRLHESLGFRLVGMYEDVGFKRGAWHTVGWWDLPLQPKPPTPTDPIAFVTFRSERSQK